MADYVFGREVTIKLPEPTRQDKASWGRIAQWDVGGYIVRASLGHRDSIQIANVNGDGLHLPDLGLALLAAADYAESGQHDVG